MAKEKNVTITMDDVNFNYKNVTISIKEHNICLVIDNDIIEEAVGIKRRKLRRASLRKIRLALSFYRARFVKLLTIWVCGD